MTLRQRRGDHPADRFAGIAESGVCPTERPSGIGQFVDPVAIAEAAAVLDFGDQVHIRDFSRDGGRPLAVAVDRIFAEEPGGETTVDLGDLRRAPATGFGDEFTFERDVRTLLEVFRVEASLAQSLDLHEGRIGARTVGPYEAILQVGVDFEYERGDRIGGQHGRFSQLPFL